MNSHIIPPTILDHQNVTKIMLGPEESEIIAGLGPHVLVLATHADATAPQSARGRIVLNCLPITQAQADGAYRVASGKARAVPIKATVSGLPPTKESL